MGFRVSPVWPPDNDVRYPAVWCWAWGGFQRLATTSYKRPTRQQRAQKLSHAWFASTRGNAEQDLHLGHSSERWAQFSSQDGGGGGRGATSELQYIRCCVSLVACIFRSSSLRLFRQNFFFLKKILAAEPTAAASHTRSFGRTKQTRDRQAAELRRWR